MKGTKKLKNKLKTKNVIFQGNSINLEDSSISEKDLIDEMKVINNQRLEVD